MATSYNVISLEMGVLFHILIDQQMITKNSLTWQEWLLPYNNNNFEGKGIVFGPILDDRLKEKLLKP